MVKGVEDWHADCVAAFRQEISECASIPELVAKSRQLISLSSQAWYLRGCLPYLNKKRDDLRAEKVQRKIVILDLKAVLYLCFCRAENPKYAGVELKNFMQSLRERFKDSIFLYADDTDVGGWRYEFDSRWKEKREKPPAGFVAFADSIRKSLRDRGAHVYSVGSFEADDVIASLAASYALAGDRTIVVANDRDLWQVLSPHTVMFWKGEFFNRESLMKRHQVDPSQWVDWLCLVGKNDIPGASGIGEVTASKLILTFGSYMNCLNSINQIRQQFTDRIADSLIAFEKEFFHVRRLHRLEQTLELEVLD